MCKEIPLTQGKTAVVDDEDYEWLSQWKWSYHTAYGYAMRSVTKNEGRNIRVTTMHREVLGCPPCVVDHRNRNKLDNRKENLRLATPNGNQWNRGIDRSNKTGFKGVRRHRNGWQASIGFRGERKHLGTFSNKYDAARAYNAAAQELHGEFACLNEVHDV